MDNYLMILRISTHMPFLSSSQGIFNIASSHNKCVFIFSWFHRDDVVYTIDLALASCCDRDSAKCDCPIGVGPHESCNYMQYSKYLVDKQMRIMCGDIFIHTH